MKPKAAIVIEARPNHARKAILGGAVEGLKVAVAAVIFTLAPPLR